jgi:chromate transporter
LIGGGLFVLPGAVLIFALALAYGSLGALPGVQALFLGVKATVVIIVIEAILRLSRRALTSRGHWVIAVLGFVALFALRLPFPLVIGLAAIWGAATAATAGPAAGPAALPWRVSLRVLIVGCTIWAAPVVLAMVAGQAFLTAVGLFFSKLAVVTFGGAYAVLAYMTQAVVVDQGWLTTPQMMDALGLAETTPGPLILVTQFVGIVAGHEIGGAWLGVLGGLMTLWVTFVPCFVWIFAGAPLIDWMEGRPRLTGALAAITAAVVGVIANLSVWFAAHVFFARVAEVSWGPLTLIAPDPGTLNLVAVGLAVIAGWLLLRRHWPLIGVLALMAGLSWSWSLIAAAV